MTCESREDDVHTLRVLVATDCHLGYMEKDDVRRNDTFLSFEEICSIAEKKQVDLLLLGGDLFHENKPSRSTLVRAITILRRYCLNDRPVQFQVVSDQTVNFPNSFGHVNYEDLHYNVGLPVFSIHGNHDDPTGLDYLSAVDILSSCNLVNYFGKTELVTSGIGQITLHPILIKKGSTSVALYGLGNIRDERLNRMFQTPHAVQWMRPEDQKDSPLSDWFNILVLHQNRVKTNPKNAISENFLPRFLDFVVWGHEHECLVDPQEVPGMGFHVTQPGSSVATSLIEGESKEKHVLLLEVKGSQYRPTKIPLKSVRPFEYKEVALKDVGEVDPNDHSSILEYLDKVVVSLMNKCDGKKSAAKLPLIRVKVDYSGFMTISPQRFGQKYVGKVANPQDLLIFSKSARKGGRGGGDEDESERLRPEELNQQNIEALVAESNLKMEILPVNDLDVALHNFVNKDDKLAFYSCLQFNLEETRSRIARDVDSSNLQPEHDFVIKVGGTLEERVKERSSNTKGSSPFVAASTKLIKVEKTRTTTSDGSGSPFSDDEDGTAGGQVALECGKKAGRGRGRGRGGRGAAATKSRQTTLDSSLGFRHSTRSASLSVRSAEEEEGKRESDSEGSRSKRGRKRGRGAGGDNVKRSKKSENPPAQKYPVKRGGEYSGDDDVQGRQLRSATPQAVNRYGNVISRHALS